MNKSDLILKLGKLRISHSYCDDGWYSCPKSEDGCADDSVDDKCNCGAEEHNELLDAIIKELINN